MNVRNILQDKGRKIYAVNEDATIRQAVEMLKSHNIGALLVTDNNGQLSGILSERDIIRRSLNQETGFRDEHVSKSMTSDVVSVAPDIGINEVMEIMTNSRIRHIPVVENGDIVGLVSIGDVVKRKIAEAEGEAAALRDYISG